MNIAVGEATTLNQLWKYICENIGINLDPQYREERKGDVRHSLANVSKAQQLIGYEPAVTIQKGLQTTVEWYKQSSYIKVTS